MEKNGFFLEKWNNWGHTLHLVYYGDVIYQFLSKENPQR